MMNKAIHKTRAVFSPFAGLDKETYMSLTKPAAVNVQYQDEGNTAVIDIDGYIGRDPFREMITGEKSPNTVQNIKATLREIRSDKIIININSPGGDLNDGLVIADLIESKSAEVITNLMGFSASAATVISQAGNIRRMSKNSFELLHRAMFGLMGYINQNTVQELKVDLNTIDKVMITYYSNRSKLSEGQVAKLMDAGGGYGQWIDAQTALKHGLIDEVYDPADEDDENIDRMEAREKERMKRNVQNLATAGLRNASESDRKAEIEKLYNRQKEIEKKVAALDQPDNTVTYRKTKVSDRLAKHEAAHAVMAIVFGVDIQKIETWNPGESDFEGAVFAGDQIGEITAWKRLAITMAGPMADFLYYGKDLHDFKVKDISGDPDIEGSDSNRANQILSALPVNEQREAIKQSLYYCRSRMIRNWHHVKSLGEEIKTHCQMSADDVQQWFNKSTKHDRFYY